jgi:hypothetical protein
LAWICHVNLDTLKRWLLQWIESSRPSFSPSCLLHSWNYSFALNHRLLPLLLRIMNYRLPCSLFQSQIYASCWILTLFLHPRKSLRKSPRICSTLIQWCRTEFMGCWPRIFRPSELEAVEPGAACQGASIPSRGRLSGIVSFRTHHCKSVLVLSGRSEIILGLL